MSAFDLRRCGPAGLDDLLPLVAAYHGFEGIRSSAEDRREAVGRLLGDPALGAIWRIEQSGALIGYIALCFGYSIEFGGRDAFIDEFFLVPDARGQGIGGRVLEAVKAEAAADGILALHLEVAEENAAAQRLYAAHGFRLRDGFHLMSAWLDKDG